MLDPQGAIAGVTGRAVEIATCAISEGLANLLDHPAEREQIAQALAELYELALHDALTRLPNRPALEERMRASLARCERNGRRCAVLFIDLDDFKAINDARGHACGDRVLVAVGDRLTKHLRASDTVARIGGDEFVVLIDDLFTDEAAVDAGAQDPPLPR